MPKLCAMDAAVIAGIEDAGERALLTMMIHCGQSYVSSYGYTSGSYSRPQRLTLPSALYEQILPRLCATGRFGFQLADANAPEVVQPLAWEAGPAWNFRLTPRKVNQNSWQIVGEFFRPGELVAFEQTRFVFANGLLAFPQQLARWNVGDFWPWVYQLSADGPITLQKAEVDSAVEKLHSLASLPPLTIPQAWNWRQVSTTPQPGVRLKLPRPAASHREYFTTVSFRYGEQEVTANDNRAAVVDRTKKQIAVRDFAAEMRLLDQLRSRGFRKSPYTYEPHQYLLPINKFMAAVQQLIADGWRVEADGQPIRTAGAFNISVTSGVDWFDVAAVCDFGGTSATLPELLAAVGRGQNFVVLGDGSRGMLPQEWLDRYSPLADLAWENEVPSDYPAPSSTAPRCEQFLGEPYRPQSHRSRKKSL